MNKKFILIIAAFTITVPGFFLFSYWYLGIFSGVTTNQAENFDVTAWVADHAGDYNKTGEQVVKISRILHSYAFNCKPMLVYYESAITVGKPYLKSAGGCITENVLPEHVALALTKQKAALRKFSFTTGYKLTTYAQTAVALRKVWVEIARLTDKGIQLKFPLVHIVHENGENDFLIAVSK